MDSDGDVFVACVAESSAEVLSLQIVLLVGAIVASCLRALVVERSLGTRKSSTGRFDSVWFGRSLRAANVMLAIS